MRLYRKQLNSIDELRQEKSRLRYARKHTGTMNFFTADLFTPSAKEIPAGGEENPGWLDMASKLLTSPTVLDSALAVGVPLTRFFPAGVQKKFLAKFAREFFGGYLRWKLLTFGLRAGKHLVQSLAKKK
jgi:hypothetical protein